MKGKDENRRIVTKVYKTIDIIADMSSKLRGRATRVYEAYDVEDPDSKVVIKDSWVDVNHPKEGDTLSEILEDASDDEKAMFLTVLVHGVVTIDGREDLTQDLLMNGYLVSTDSPKSNDKGSNYFDELEEMIANAGIVDDVEDTAQGDHVYRASIFKVLKSGPRLSLDFLRISPHVSINYNATRPPRVYGPKAHCRIVFKEKGQSLQSMSCLRQIKLPLVLQAMDDILKGSMILSDSASGYF